MKISRLRWIFPVLALEMLGLFFFAALAQNDASTLPTAYYGKHGQVFLPDDSITPGVIRTSNQKEICDPKFRTAPFRHTTQAMKNQAYKEYGVERNKGVCLGGCEVDHRVPLELGGLDDIKNLWPQPSKPAPGFHEKDKLENSLRHQVCIDKKMSLGDAQKALMGDWYVAYLKMSSEPNQSNREPHPHSAER